MAGVLSRDTPDIESQWPRSSEFRGVDSRGTKRFLPTHATLYLLLCPLRAVGGHPSSVPTYSS
ncbi:hypothetical protein I79_021075 [Cricetulus griseus]|uniref:Uncharacterized protein n=1 Tax=Cricetulus griseus TaxID=10029 RepID=G3IBP4_CRIGR|nr:hypothetical protein I79_021075 [Cricetulus griseus]